MTTMKRIDANFTLSGDGLDFSLVFHARGGGGLNTGYAEGLTAILGVLKKLRAELVSAYVDSATAAKLSMPHRLIVDARTDLETIDPDPFRRQLCKRAAKVGRKPGAKGSGNGTKRIRLDFSLPRGRVLDALTDQIAKGTKS